MGKLSEMVLGLREIIEPKLIYSPFLRLIIFSVWFQIGFAAVLLTLISAALYLPKIWRVSPPEFEPIIRRSGLDLTQNWALKRNARKLEAAGEFEKAAETWRGAVSENAADLSALHGYLKNCLNLKRPEPRFTAPALAQIQWLLRLNRTNAADVELVARVCDSFAMYDAAAYFLTPLKNVEFSEVTEAVLTKSLFHRNQIPEFAARIGEKPKKEVDPELALYRSAYRAGWSEGPSSTEAFAELERATQESDRSGRVGHLLLRAAAEKNKVDLYARELDRLASRNEANAGDHAFYWALLAQNGRTNEATRLAQDFTTPPETAGEVLRVAQSYVALGLTENARDLLKRLAPRFGGYAEIWIAYGNILEQREDWDELRAIGRLIRGDVGVREILWGLSYYFEGRADLAQKRDAAAKVAFERAAESSYEMAQVGPVVARELTRHGHPELALQIYRKVEPSLEGNVGFWNEMLAAAFAAKDSEALLRAAERAYQLDPKDFMVLNRYAACLLVKRVRPDEAIQLTLQLYTKFPQSISTIINHSCALVLNGRAAEAKALLEKINKAALSSIEISPYHFTLFEAYHALKDWDRAWKAREMIAESTLFPEQLQALQEKDKEMPKRLAEKS